MMDQQPMVSFGVILIIIVAALILPGIATGIVLSRMREPIASRNSRELVGLRDEIGQLREEVEKLRDEVGRLNAVPRPPSSTDIKGG